MSADDILYFQTRAMNRGSADGNTDFGAADRAVSEVLGVVFMVGITVIIAAIVGVFALGLSQQAAQAEPPVAIGLESVDANADEVVLEHDGGERLSFSEITIKVRADGSTVTFPASTGASTSWEPGATITVNTSNQTVLLDGTGVYSSADGSVDFQTGDTVTVTVIDDDSGTILAERTVLV